MPEEHTNRTGRPREGLRVGPWLGKKTPKGPGSGADQTGPSWTAPTAELRPARPGPAGAKASGSPGGAIYGARSGRPSHYTARRRLAGTIAGLRPVPHRLREYSWLFASGALALVVLVCSRSLVSSPEPVWHSDGSATITSTETAAPTAPTAAVLSASATPPPTDTPEPTATSSPSPRRSTARPLRTASPRPSAPRSPAQPVLLGPASGRALWSMLNRYCTEVQQGREAQLRSGTSPAEGNWECRRRGPDILIDMNAACQYAYGSAAFARYTDRENAFSWRCYRQP